MAKNPFGLCDVDRRRGYDLMRAISRFCHDITLECRFGTRNVLECGAKSLKRSRVFISVVKKVDSAIRWINLYPVDRAIGFPNTFPLDSDLSGG